MMKKTNIFNRIKTAVVGAAMIATTFAAPAMSSVMTATAAAQEVKAPFTLIADGVDEGKRQGNFAIDKSQQNSKSFTITGSTASKESGTIAVYGFGISEKPYWVDADVTTKSSGGSFTLSVDVPAEAQGKVTKIGIGIWYPKDSSEWKIESIKGSGTAAEPTPVGPSIPTSANDKSGTYTFTDNKDGTATITATLSAQYAFSKDAEGNPVTQSDILLTQGTDEEDYAPYKDADGNLLPKWEEGDPINSHKFKFTDFGIADIENIAFQSFEFVVKSDDYDMSTIQYGGGINVAKGSDADTESVKGKDGYWYNDQGADDMDAYGDKFLIDDVHGGYEATGIGGYGKLVWDVPKGVQPCIDYSNTTNAVGFQFWWGKDDTKESTSADGEAQNYAEIPELHLVSCTATYTRTMTVPYNKTVEGPKNINLSTGDSNEISLADLNLGERDKVSAVLFHFKSASELTQFVGGVGISVDEAKAGSSAAGVVDGWYNPGNITVINTNGEFDVMWILPEVIGKSVYAGDDGKVMIGYWYGDKDGEAVSDITIPSVTYYVYESQEEPVEIIGSDGLKLPEEITLKVGETYDLDVNVEGATFESERPNVVSVDENGKLEALVPGLSIITVTTPEGQEATITIRVEEADTTTVSSATTATSSTSKTTTSSTTVNTTVDPDITVNWDRVLYGDVNVDGDVGVADVARLVKYLISKERFTITATGKENANVEYDDGVVNSADVSKLSSYVLKKIGLMDLGPKDKSNLKMYQKLGLL